MKTMTYFAAQGLMGSRVAHYYREFLHLQHLPPEELRSLQQFRLAATLQHAKETVPFYRSLPGADARELTSFGILTKDGIRENFEQLMAPRLLQEYKGGSSRWRYGWALVKTGGSTGMPTSVIHTPEYRDRGRASRLFSQYLCGFPVGTPYFRLWGSMQEINHARDSIQQRVMRWLLNEKLLNAFQMSETDMRAYITAVNDAGIDHMMAYTDAAHELARFCQRKSLKVRPLRSLMACAGTVTEDFRAQCQSVFQCRVHNKYGSRDCADIACECDRGRLHIYTNNVFVEIVDERGNSVPSGQPGRILITLLGNDDFPMIRYEIGDVGAVDDGTCDCGRAFPLLRNLEGRNVEFLLTNQGAYVSPVFIRHLIGVVHNPGVLRRFQLTQDSLETYTLQFEIEPDASPAALKGCLAAIDLDLKAVFGSRSSIKCSQVVHIPPSPSGKFLYTRCNVQREN
jgi:phenylacetate-CoA ligase